MTERKNMISFPAGVVNIYGENVINPGTDSQTIEERIKRINTPENLQEIINGKNGSSHLFTARDYADGTRMSLVLPTGPYTERSTMLGVYNEKLGEKEETQFIYDYPAEVKNDYWHMVLAGLQAHDEILEEEGRYGVVSVWAENTMKITKTTQAKRTSRTVRFPHGQFLEIDEERVHPTTGVLHHMEEEQDILERGYLVDRFGRRMFEKIESDARELKKTFQVRRNAPFGYQVSFPFDMTQSNIDSITQFMSDHHEAYKSTGEHYLQVAGNHRFALSKDSKFYEKLEKVKEQPAYRTYFVANGEEVDVVISPMFWSHGGVMESMGIRLDRSPDHEKRTSDEERLNHGQRIAEAITRELERED